MPEKHGRAYNKSILLPYRAALYDFDPAALEHALTHIFTPDTKTHLCFPFETLDGPLDLLERAILPLSHALPDMERRDMIVMAGPAQTGDWYVGCCGFYIGTFVNSFLDIPPTNHVVGMRYHEFFRLDGDRVTEFQGIWDIPELMMQANAWPMAPSLGREWQVPAPALQNGLTIENNSATHAQTSLQLVADMLEGLSRFADGGVAAMNLDAYWHPTMNWYGPAGIGTGRGIAGFRKRHQIPFLRGMPNRRVTENTSAFFADGDYVGTTGWPNMQATLSGDGWMGVAPANQNITMRSLDFWRCENGKIRENWVLVDLLNVYDQLGVDVLHRMREYV